MNGNEEARSIQEDNPHPQSGGVSSSHTVYTANIHNSTNIRDRTKDHSSHRRNNKNNRQSTVTTRGGNCIYCEMREHQKQHRLNSIKEQILSKLRLNSVPNITKPISLPPGIIEKVFKNERGSDIQLDTQFTEPDEYHFNRKGILFYPSQCEYYICVLICVLSQSM